MSIPSQASGRASRMMAASGGRWWHFLLTTLLVLLSLPIFAAVGVALRLWLGPIDVTDSARRLLAQDRTPAVSFSRMQLAWNGWAEGPSAPLGLVADGVRWEDPDNGTGNAAHAYAAFDLPALLHGRVALLALRASDGSLSLAHSPVASPRQATATTPNAPHAARGRLDLRQLSEFDISRMAFTVGALAAGRSCRAEIADLRLTPLRRPAAIGVTGAVSAAVSCGGASLSVHGRAREGPEGGIVWHITTARFVPAVLAPGLAALAPLATLDLPVQLRLDAALSGGFGRFMLPRTLDMTAQLGAGGIGAASGRVPVRDGELHVSLSLPDSPDGEMRAVLSNSRLVLDEGAGTPVLGLAGTLLQSGQVIRAQVEGRVDRFDFAGLERIWPSDLARGGRRWVTQNIVAGEGRNLLVAAGLGSQAGWRGLDLATLSGSLDASGITLFWLHPIAPLREMDAHLVLEGPDSLRIESKRAVQAIPGHGAIVAGPTLMRITGLSLKTQLGRIDTTLTGALPDLLVLLAHPRLRLLSRHPLAFTHPSGDATVRLGLSLPLIDQVKADDIPVQADATLNNVHLGNVAAGRDLDAANLVVHASNQGLQLQGSGAIGGVPARFTYGMDFRPGGPAQATETAHLVARLEAAAIRREGLDSGRRMTGTASAVLDYLRHRSGAARLALSCDLADAGLTTPIWRKSAGEAAQASGVIGLQDGRLVSVDALHASGAGLLLEAHAEIAQGEPRAVVIDRFAVGRSRGQGRIGLPAPASHRPLQVTLDGTVLDLAPFLVPAASPPSASRAAASPAGASPAGASPAGASPAGASPAGAPPAGASHVGAPGLALRQAAEAGLVWRADLDFRSVLFSASRSFSDARLRAQATGKRISSASLLIKGPTPVEATLSPDTGSPNAGARRLVLRAPDAGALLAALGVGSRVEGGALSLDGRVEDRTAGLRLTALARIGRFTVHDAPLAARLARDLSIYGFLLGSPSKQLVVTRFELPFTLEGNTLEVTDAHASNAALGATLRGPVDLRQQTLDLRGTIVPSYLFNALPGALPGVGRVFSPEKGGGLLAATLRITGAIDHPAVRVNPLALLAPGILRRLLFD